MLLAELEKLVSAEILCVRGPPANRTFAFKHALLEEALHEAFAAAVERWPAVSCASVCPNRAVCLRSTPSIVSRLVMTLGDTGAIVP